MTAAGPGEALHATAVALREAGVLILGRSGAGKSALGLALIDRVRGRGHFAALIGDDRVWARAAGGRPIVSGAADLAGWIERRGVGLLRVPAVAQAVLRLAVELTAPGERPDRMPDAFDSLMVAGLPLPRLALDSAVSAADQAAIVDERLTAAVARNP